MPKSNNEIRYHLVIGLEIDEPKQRYLITLGCKFRYELTTYLKLARNLIESGNLAQIKADGGKLYFAEGIDQHTGASIGKYGSE